MLNELYETEWRLLFNYFIPYVKLLDKTREGSKTTCILKVERLSIVKHPLQSQEYLLT